MSKAPIWNARLSVHQFEVQMIKENLNKLRHWFSGFEAAGGRAPLNTDVLRQAEILLSKVEWPSLKK